MDENKGKEATQMALAEDILNWKKQNWKIELGNNPLTNSSDQKLDPRSQRFENSYTVGFA